MTADLSWQERALCSQTDPDAFHPEKGGSTVEARRICRRCEVQPACLQYALDTRQPHGVWGGMTERERKALLRRRKAEAAAG
jgi:WhiB family redox-sensing transcriptional regulator